MRLVTLTFVASILMMLLSPVAGAANDRLERRIEELRNAGHFPGVAVAVLRDGAPVDIVLTGQANIEHDVPVSADTVFELASLTKQMTALAVMTLVADGRLSLDAPVTDFVEDAPEAWATITVDMLLSHMGGLKHRFERTVEGVLLLEYSAEDMLQSARETPMHSEPGTDWNYSDQGYFLLGEIVEQVTGQSFDEHMQTTYFEPIGMTQTRFLDQSAIIPNRAEGYAFVDGEVVRNRRVWQFGQTAHFGVTSTLSDMLLWEAELSDPQIINREALEATWPVQREFYAGQNCAMWGPARGWVAHHRQSQRILSHGGYAGTAYIRNVDSGLSVIVLTNREETGEAMSPVDMAWSIAHVVDETMPEGGPRCWE